MGASPAAIALLGLETVVAETLRGGIVDVCVLRCAVQRLLRLLEGRESLRSRGGRKTGVSREGGCCLPPYKIPVT